jgi:hypothetical protein
MIWLTGQGLIGVDRLQVRIMDALGQVVITEELPLQGGELDAAVMLNERLAGGPYIVRLEGLARRTTIGGALERRSFCRLCCAPSSDQMRLTDPVIFSAFLFFPLGLAAQPGSLDLSFDPGSGFDEQVFSLAIQPDGKAIIGGRFGIFDGASRNRICRLNDDGSLDVTFSVGTGFGTGSFNTVYALACNRTGK